MNEPPVLPAEPSEPSAPQPRPPAMPLWARLLNVFAVPGDVFDDIKHSRRSLGTWLVPILIACVVGVVSSVILFSQPNIRQGIRDMQGKQMEKQSQAIQKQVDAGKIEQAKADATIKAMEKAMEFTSSPVFLKIAGSAGAVVISTLRVFWWALVIWLISVLILKSGVPYWKAVEVAGLSTMVSTLGAIATLLLQVNLGRSNATISPALAMTDFDPTNKLHLVLGALNLVQIWMLILLGIGLSRLANVPFGRVGLFVFLFWFLQQAALILMGAGMAVM